MFYVYYKGYMKRFIFTGKMLDLGRSETMPLIEKRIQEHEVTIENETCCRADLVQGFMALNESSINECARDK
jgi:hypothetical protein